jgi:hypothetical protein
LLNLGLFDLFGLSDLEKYNQTKEQKKKLAKIFNQTEIFKLKS